MAAQPTWAQVARRKTTPAFLPTECAVNLEQFAAPLRIPPSSSRYSAFVPLPSTYTQGWALEIISAIPTSAVGIVPRADISLLEVCFANKEVQQDFLSSPFVYKHFTSHSCPRRPATKVSKKRSNHSNKRKSVNPPSPIATAVPATADTADMDEDTPNIEPILFPFELTPEQAQTLNNLTPEQWIKHCQNVRSNHPRTEPEIDRFLSLPIEEIVRVFHEAVTHLVASSTPADPTSPSSAPESSP